MKEVILDNSKVKPLKDKEEEKKEQADTEVEKVEEEKSDTIDHEWLKEQGLE